MQKLTLDDLKPEEGKFTLSTRPGKEFTLKTFSLRDQIFARKKFGDKLKDIFTDDCIEELSELAFHLLKEKEEFKDVADFQEAFVAPTDRKALLFAVMATVGASQPVIKKLTEESLGNGSPLS